MRDDPQLLSLEAPCQLASHRGAKRGIDAAADGVYHLAVEHRIGRRRLASAADQDTLVVEIDLLKIVEWRMRDVSTEKRVPFGPGFSVS
jgi:hypothetical protein